MNTPGAVRNSTNHSEALPIFEGYRDRISFWSFEGDIVRVDQWTETQISSSGGVVMDGSTVSPPRIRGSTKLRQRIWLRRQDGTEVPLAGDESVAVAPGHRIAVVVAKNDKTGKQIIQALVNYTALAAFDLSQPGELSAVEHGGMRRWVSSGGGPLIWWPATAIVCGILNAIVRNHVLSGYKGLNAISAAAADRIDTSWAFWVPFVPLIAWEAVAFFRAQAREQRVNSDYQNHVKEITGKLLAFGPDLSVQPAESPAQLASARTR